MVDCIILVKTSDRIGVTDVAQQKGSSWRSGYILNKYPVDHIFSNREKNVSNYLRIQINEEEWDDAWIESESVYNEELESNEITLLRKYYIDFRSLVGLDEVLKIRSKDFDKTQCGSDDFSCNCELCDVGILAVENLAVHIKENIWEDRPEPWVAHGSAGIFTIRASGGDYSTLSAWEAAEQSDLTADGGQGLCIAECYNDWPTGLDDRVSITGWTTDASNYVKIYTPISERHTGTLYSGFTIVNGISNLKTLITSQNYTHIEGIAVHCTAGGASARAIESASTLGSIFISCVSTHDLGLGFMFSSGSSTIQQTAINCIAINCGTSGFLTSSHARYYNCTAISNANRGFASSSGDGRKRYYKNNLASGNTLGDFATDGDIFESFNNASSDDTADNNGGSGNRINQTFSFIDISSDNVHLAPNDTGAFKHGLDLSNDAYYPFDTDIDGDTRGDTWSIGVDNGFDPNGCFVKNNTYFNEKPVYSNGISYMFWSSNRWVISSGITDNQDKWHYYGAEFEYYPTNNDNRWEVGLAGVADAGFIGDDCPSSSSSSSSSSGVPPGPGPINTSSSSSSSSSDFAIKNLINENNENIITEENDNIIFE